MYTSHMCLLTDKMVFMILMNIWQGTLFVVASFFHFVSQSYRQFNVHPVKLVQSEFSLPLEI